jgi:tetratricopeptide (TPR) repeat protein
LSVTPIIAAVASTLDQRSARLIAELEQKQDWPGLLKLAQAQLQREPDRAEWWALQGYALARQGLHSEAIASYERALRISPEEEHIWLALGQSQSELGRPEQAAKTYKQALRYRPESAPAYLALAELYRRQGQLDLAIYNYRECVRYQPESEQAWYGLAVSYHLGGQRDRRDQALKGLRKLAPAAADQFEKQYLSK